MAFYNRGMAVLRKWLSGLSIIQWGIGFFFGLIPLFLAWVEEGALSSPLLVGFLFFILAIASMSAINR
ncbi:MAG: hypothetical protein ACREQW_06745 [Candidatus Binatia bacterium]